MKSIQHVIKSWRDLEPDFFQPGEQIVVAAAPGRLDVMGGFGDYSGSLVLELPTREATCVGVQRAKDGEVEIVSLPRRGDQSRRSFHLQVEEWQRLLNDDFEAARERFVQNVDDSWAAYPVGVVCVLARERGLNFDQGLRILAQSDVPEGKGVSSSAALEVAAMRAIAELAECGLEGHELARLCQIAENRIAGAPCGIMDQMTSALGQEGHLLALLCQPADVQGHVPVPPEIRFWGIDSGVRHAVSGSDYTTVRTAAFMGYRIIADLAGLSVEPSEVSGMVRVEDSRWNGYLANLTSAEFESEFAARLPTEMTGAEFLAIYGGTTDAVTRVDPSVEYRVLPATVHPIYENERVHRFEQLLTTPLDDDALRELGGLLYAAHASYTSCGLGSDATDTLVEMVRRAGSEHGLFGAKITGGGSGGTVVVLGKADAADAIEDIVSEYEGLTKYPPHLFSGSSSGACRMPCLHTTLC